MASWRPILPKAAMAQRHAFVFSVVGDRHVGFANLALSFLKRVSRRDIVVVRARSSRMVAHDQVVDVAPPVEYDDHQASILLKTDLLNLVGSRGTRFCYLDSDVIAVDDEVDSIFEHRSGPVAFAADAVDIDMFSRYGVNCRCAESRCGHLRESILRKFDVRVGGGDWRMWNGGVFLFDGDSAPFLSLWRDYSRRIMGDPPWSTRDQGTLAATVWKLGLQEQALLPSAFNFIVDRLSGIPRNKREGLVPAQFHIAKDYSLTGAAGLTKPHFLHFINGGMGWTGWRNWDEVAALQSPRTASRGNEPR
jgi:hypothetical protein